MFNDYKKMLDINGLTDIQRAARYLFIIKSSFGASIRAFGANNNNNLKNTIDYLPEIKERLRKVVIENKDFENLIKDYDRADALFYLDPPYVSKRKYYDSDFVMDDHRRLNTVLKDMKGKFLLSYNDNEMIRELYKGFEIIAIERNSNLTTKSKPTSYKELIIKNY